MEEEAFFMPLVQYFSQEDLVGPSPDGVVSIWFGMDGHMELRGRASTGITWMEALE